MLKRLRRPYREVPCVPLLLAFSFFAIAVALHERFSHGMEVSCYLAASALSVLCAYGALVLQELLSQRHGMDPLPVQILEVFSTVLQERDRRTCGHCRRVAQLSAALAARAGMSRQDQQLVYLCGVVHDIGKISVPDAILNKDSVLTDSEYSVVREHPERGARMLALLDDARADRIVDCVRHHHERYDGSGYPNGLLGDDIPILARLLSIADTFDAMTSDRPYHAPHDVDHALDEILSCTGSQFDPHLAWMFVAMIREGGEPTAPVGLQPAGVGLG